MDAPETLLGNVVCDNNGRSLIAGNAYPIADI
jgi:hypothetical protein